VLRAVSRNRAAHGRDTLAAVLVTTWTARFVVSDPHQSVSMSTLLRSPIPRLAGIPGAVLLGLDHGQRAVGGYYTAKRPRHRAPARSLRGDRPVGAVGPLLLGLAEKLLG
jgi:hypothetical protein